MELALFKVTKNTIEPTMFENEATLKINSKDNNRTIVKRFDFSSEAQCMTNIIQD